MYAVLEYFAPCIYCSMIVFHSIEIQYKTEFKLCVVLRRGRFKGRHLTHLFFSDTVAAEKVWDVEGS